MSYFLAPFFIVLFLTTLGTSFGANNCKIAFEEVLQRLDSPSVKDIVLNPKVLSKTRDDTKSYLEVIKIIHDTPLENIELGQLTNLKNKVWVDVMVPGLYESIPATEKMSVNGYELITFRNKDKGLTSVIIGSHYTEVGSVSRMISASDKSIIFKEAELKGSFKKLPQAETAPRFLKPSQVTPLVPEKGIPTQTFLTLQQMRIQGIIKGELTSGKIEIDNIRTLLEVADSTPVRAWILANPGMNVPMDVLTAAIMETHSMRYIQTVLTQSGHKIVKAKVTKAHFNSASKIAEKMIETTDFKKEAVFLIQKKLPDGTIIPLAPDQPLPEYLDIVFELAPL